MHNSVEGMWKPRMDAFLSELVWPAMAWIWGAWALINTRFGDAQWIVGCYAELILTYLVATYLVDWVRCRGIICSNEDLQLVTRAGEVSYPWQIVSGARRRLFRRLEIVVAGRPVVIGLSAFSGRDIGEIIEKIEAHLHTVNGQTALNDR